MAGAIIPLVATAVGVLGPLIPTVVQQVEQLIGHSSATGQKGGDQKLTLATSILAAVLTALANAGVIPSAPVVDPALKIGLTGAVQQAVDVLKAQGVLGAPAIAVKSTTTALAGAGKVQVSITVG